MSINDSYRLDSTADSKRLLAIVPLDLADHGQFANRIRLLAIQYQAEIIYISLVLHEDERQSARRLLISLVAITSDNLQKSSSQIIKASNWAEAIKLVYEPGDLVACLDSHMIRINPFRPTSLYELLEKQINIPVHLITGQPKSYLNPIRRTISELGFWCGILVIAVGFSLIEIRLDNLIGGISQEITLVILVIFEIGLIYEWNKIFG